MRLIVEYTSKFRTDNFKVKDKHEAETIVSAAYTMGYVVSEANIGYFIPTTAISYARFVKGENKENL